MVQTNATLANRTYKDYSNRHAMLMLHIIRARQLEPLSANTVEQIAKGLIYCGDYFPEDIQDHHNQILSKTTAFIHMVMETTSLPSITTVNEAIRQSCHNQSSIPVICPATTTICALNYLHRFKTKFGIFTHTSAISNRLFLVAYLVAAKFIHANLKSLVMMENIDPIPTLPTTPPPSQDTSSLLSQLDDSFMPDQDMDAALLCSMEVEFIHFMDYQLQIRPNPLQLWPWFYTVLEDYCQQYHTTVGIGSNYQGTTDTLKTAAAS